MDYRLHPDVPLHASGWSPVQPAPEVNHWKGLFVGAADKVHRRHNLASLRSKYSTDLLNLIGKMLNPDKKARPTAGELHMEVTNERCITI